MTGFLTYLVEDAPEIDETFPLSKALEVIAWMHREFCFTNEQSRVHAIARLLTPFARGSWDGLRGCRFGTLARIGRGPEKIICPGSL